MFITDVVVPNAVFFSYLVAWSEFLIGLSLIAGCLTRVSAAFAWFHNLNIYLAIAIPSGGAQLAINRLYLVLHILFVIASAGRSWGLDGLLHRRFPKSKWF
jgi:thiosulfate dehydrogenase [quinone] large subunit